MIKIMDKDEASIDLNNAETTPDTVLQTSDVDNDLIIKVKKLETEKHKMQTEFNMQRAKMKDLFLQKETESNRCRTENEALQRELNELKSQIVLGDMKSEQELKRKDLKAQEEIHSLQQLVQDTIEESAICKTEMQHLKLECRRLRTENKELREIVQQNQQQQQQQESTSLGPQVLSQVKKTLARKLGGESAAAHATAVVDATINDSTKKPAEKYAHEDAELLRSIVIQLQEEMKALKEKLREADEKLQINCSAKNALNESEEENASTAVLIDLNDAEKQLNKSTSMEMVFCANCQLAEEKVQKMQELQKENEEKISKLQKRIEDADEDLEKEAALRKNLDDDWQEKREQHKAQVEKLREEVERNEKQLQDMQQKFLETKDEISRQLQRLTDEREEVNKHLETLQMDNEFLAGEYLATAEEIESKNIDLPNSVEELQELLLQQRNALIQARVRSRYEEQKCVSSLDEIKILRDQLLAINEERRAYKKKVQSEMKSLENRVKEYLVTQQEFETTKTSFERKEADLNREITELRVQIIELQGKCEKLTKMIAEYKAKIINLQTDLTTSEQVQKDFVKLSQSLQIALEKLRSADTEVRWQHDDDVDNCPTCSALFTVTVRKMHCRHCGSIYCEKCLSKFVPSGPRKRLARVCDICHTLLTPNTAPYFSHTSAETT